MKSSQEILNEVKKIFSTKWEKRDGRKVPEPESLGLGNDAVIIEGTVLYADMAESTALVDNFKNWFAAEVYKSYLVAACHIIRNQSGEITSFDGDRVMAVFVGDRKNSSAAKAALQISYIIKQINLLIKEKYPNTAHMLKQSVGIDSSPIFAARTGIRNSNDIVWVGRAANYAAKLCGLRDNSYSTFITSSVFNALSVETKLGGNPRRSMWQKGIWPEKGSVIYKSNWSWSF